ncbi:Epsin-3, clathrin recruitment and traffic between the Golgi and endosome, partial [Lobosporangium transversale]
QYFNEIMPAIFKRFAEKEPREWRQIYKSLVLLEYLVTHGSERVVDEARGHISTIKVLRNFQYVDDNGKDEGINVRNRAKEFAEMLSSVDRIKEERKKAKANRNKYVGAEGGGFAGTGSRFGGFGSDSYYDGGSGGYGGYSGSGSGSSYRSSDRYTDRGSSSRSGRYDDDDLDSPSSPPARRNPRRTDRTETPKVVPKPEPVKEVNLFDFDEPAAAPPSNQNAFGSSASKPVDDGWGALQSATDDFDDFQSAPPVEQKTQSQTSAFPAYNPTMTSALPPVRANSTSSNISGTFGGLNSKPSGGAAAFDLLGSSPVKSNTMASFSSGAIPPMSANSTTPSNSRPNSSFSAPANNNNNNNASASNPNDIWANASGLISLDGLGKTKTKEAAPSMNTLAANSWNSGAWASKPTTPAASNQNTMAFGNFGGMSASNNNQPAKKVNNYDFDDLLS